MILQNYFKQSDTVYHFWITSALTVIETVLLFSGISFPRLILHCGYAMACVILGTCTIASMAIQIFCDNHEGPPIKKLKLHVGSLVVLGIVQVFLWCLHVWTHPTQGHYSETVSLLGSIVYTYPNWLICCEEAIIVFVCFLALVVPLWNIPGFKHTTVKAPLQKLSFFLHAIIRRNFFGSLFCFPIAIFAGSILEIWSKDTRLAICYVAGPAVFFTLLYTCLYIHMDQLKEHPYKHRLPMTLSVFLNIVHLFIVTSVLLVIPFFMPYPHLLISVGCLGLFVYVLTFGDALSQNPFFVKTFSFYKRVWPAVYTLAAILTFLRMTQFALSSPLSPVQWIQFVVVFFLGLLCFFVSWGKESIAIKYASIGLCWCCGTVLVAYPLSRWHSGYIIKKFLVQNKALTYDAQKKPIVKAIQNPEACSIKQILKFQRALNILYILAPERLTFLTQFMNSTNNTRIFQDQNKTPWNKIVESIESKIQASLHRGSSDKVLSYKDLVVSKKEKLFSRAFFESASPSLLHQQQESLKRSLTFYRVLDALNLSTELTIHANYKDLFATGSDLDDWGLLQWISKFLSKLTLQKNEITL